MEQIPNLLLVLCALSPLELKGATVSHQITPSPSESTTLHEVKKDNMITTIKQSRFAKPSQETHTFSAVVTHEARTAAYSGKHGSKLETSTGPTFKLMNPTTQRPSSPTVFQTKPNTEKPNSTSETEMNTTKATVLEGVVNTDPPVLTTILNYSKSYETHTEIRNHTPETTARQYTTTPTLLAGISTRRLSTASTSAHMSTRPTPPKKWTTMKTRKTARPFKPQTPPPREQPGETHGIVAAVLIGIILLMMFVGFFVIIVKKQKWQRRQLENSEWAGPSPFLDGSTQSNFSRDSTKQDSKRISIAGFLPQNLSKRNSLLNDTDDGLDMDVLPGVTFGQNNTAETESLNKTSQDKNGKTVKEQEHKSSQSSSEDLQKIHDLNPNPEALVIQEDNTSKVNPKESPSIQPPPATSENTPASPPDTGLQSSDETTPASVVQIPPAPALPQS